MTILTQERYQDAINAFWAVEENTTPVKEIPTQTLSDCVMLSLRGKPFLQSTHDSIEQELVSRVKK